MRRGKRAAKTKKVTLVLPQAPSEGATPCSSVVPSAYASDNGDSGDEMPKRANNLYRLTLQDFNRKKSLIRTLPSRSMPATSAPTEPFRFLDLPSEIRLKVYGYHFASSAKPVDLSRDNHETYGRQLALLRTCRLVHNEASHFFYSTHTFRLFPTGTALRYKETRKPLLARLGYHQRQDIRSLELRLGPHWSRPPRGWVVNDALGLKECRDVEMLRVFVQLDTSQDYLSAFVVPGAYEAFSRDLLKDVLRNLPCVKRVEFDAERAVAKDCLIMRQLLEATRAAGKEVCWGPKRGWRAEGN
jgi:hypothetical protein